MRLLALALSAATLVAAGRASGPTTAPTSAAGARTQAVPDAAGVTLPGVNPFGRRDRFRRADALPGVAILSDGTILPGHVHTTLGRNWEVWSAAEKRFRHIPPILVLSIRAVVVEAGMEKEWRWKEMGSDEKVFTGRTKPVRRFRWRFHLIDDSVVTGAVKGQPVWVRSPEKRHGPFVLHERSAGKYGQTLKDLLYVRRIVISRRAMNDAIRAAAAASRPASKPADE